MRAPCSTMAACNARTRGLRRSLPLLAAATVLHTVLHTVDVRLWVPGMSTPTPGNAGRRGLLLSFLEDQMSTKIGLTDPILLYFLLIVR